MSTYHYLECGSHNPPLRSVDEVEQHRDSETLSQVRRLVANRAVIGAFADADLVGPPVDRFLRNAFHFCVEHQRCVVNLVTEYGERETIPAVNE